MSETTEEIADKMSGNKVSNISKKKKKKPLEETRRMKKANYCMCESVFNILSCARPSGKRSLKLTENTLSLWTNATLKGQRTLVKLQIYVLPSHTVGKVSP